jgi:hypothetical protein
VTQVYPRRRADVKVQVLDGETVVLDRRRLRIHRLNSTATCVWEACDGRHSPDTIAQQIERRFRVSGEVALRDVSVTLAHLASAGLLESEAAGPSSRDVEEER